MANKKKEYFKPGPMTEGKRSIIQGLLQEYDIKSASDIQEALKDLLGGTIKEMMETEMEDHLGYEKSARSENKGSDMGIIPSLSVHILSTFSHRPSSSLLYFFLYEKASPCSKLTFSVPLWNRAFQDRRGCHDEITAACRNDRILFDAGAHCPHPDGS